LGASLVDGGARLDVRAGINNEVQLAKNRLSDNVGGVKPFPSTPWHAEKSAIFALIDGVAFSNRRLARNRFQVRTQFDPCISSVATAIMITTSNSSLPRSGTPNQFSRCSTAHHRDVRAVPRANRTRSTAVKLGVKIYSDNDHVRLLSPEPVGWIQHHQLYSSAGADTVMESITLIEGFGSLFVNANRLSGDPKATHNLSCLPRLYSSITDRIFL
jgi:hypothetical protein